MAHNPVRWFRYIAVIVTAIGMATYFSQQWSLRTGIDALETRVAYQLQSFSTALSVPTDKYSYLPEILASHPLIVSALQDRKDTSRLEETNVFLQRLNVIAKSEVIYILDPNGLTIAASNWREPYSFVGNNYAFRPYFQDALHTGSGRFYGMGTTSLLPGYYISHVVQHGDKILGVLVIKVGLQTIDDDWRTDGAEFTVTDEHGVIFLSSRKEWKYRPTYALSYAVDARIKQTRQYEGVLKEPMQMELVRYRGQDQKIVEIRSVSENEAAQESTRYFVKSDQLTGSDWMIHVFVPMKSVEERSMRIAGLTAGVLAFLILLTMYLQQFYSRIFEREKSRIALQEAHTALEQKHSELQRVSEELRISSITDPLTGTFNRRYFLESVDRMITFAKRHHQPLSIIVIDVDHFKRINDMHGHPVGDMVLRALTSICNSTIRESDLLARFGGEEFIMALPNTDECAAQAVAERLRQTLNDQPIEIDGQLLYVSISGGISQYRFNEGSIDKTIQRADQAMYTAKKNGRNRIIIH